MKIFCPLSGISYEVSIGLGESCQAPHPVFYLETARLGKELESFLSGKLSDTELHLLGCALLKKLPVVWERTLRPSVETSKHWKRCLELLYATVSRVEGNVISPDRIPQYHLDEYNDSIGNLLSYLREINGAIHYLYADSEVEGEVQPHILRQEEERLLSIIRQKLNYKEKQKDLPKLIAKWACDVGNFPTGYFPCLETGDTIAIKDHWYGIIKEVFEVSGSNYISMITGNTTVADVEELLEHCESHIEWGTTHSVVLFRKLREAKAVLEEFHPSRARKENISAMSITADMLGGLGGEVEVEVETETNTSGNLTSPPQRHQYSSLSSYLQAKISYQKGAKS